jgi:glycosyltransferase involved in cell wall biosynthesis
MNIHWFSPLPPAKTGIAQYTACLMPVLASKAHVTLWTDQAEWDPALENYGPVRWLKGSEPAWKDLNLGDCCFFHLGNHHGFHGAIWEVSRRHPGVIVLHDHCLQDFFAAVFKATGRHAEYIAQMARYYGAAGRQAAEQFIKGVLGTEVLSQYYPFSPLAVENALGVLVHTVDAQTDLKRCKRWPIALAPLPFAATPEGIEQQSGRFHKYATRPPYRLVMFGYIAANRRLDIVLQALADFPRRDCFRLDVFGELWNPAEMQAKIQSLGLQRLVTLHGFVDDDRLESALESAHLAINLRFPTMGEASLSQLRIWNHSLPSLVTRVGWYASLPEHAVTFVSVEEEKQDLCEHWNAFLTDPAAFAARGRNGRRVLEEAHAPDPYCHALLEFAEAVRPWRAATLAFHLADRVSAHISQWASPQLGDDASRRVAEEILSLVK